jgi:hypothetical protein
MFREKATENFVIIKIRLRVVEKYILSSNFARMAKLSVLLKPFFFFFLEKTIGSK